MESVEYKAIRALELLYQKQSPIFSVKKLSKTL